MDKGDGENGREHEMSNVNGRRSRDEEHESRSGSDNMDGASDDDLDAADTLPRKKRYHRRTLQQIRDLQQIYVGTSPNHGNSSGSQMIHFALATLAQMTSAFPREEEEHNFWRNFTYSS